MNSPLDEDHVRLNDIIRFIEDCEAIVNKPMNERRDDLALAYAVAVVGEASNHLSDETKALMPEIPWPGVISLRNRIIHAYGHINHRLLRAIIDEEVPLLKKVVLRTIQQLSSQ